MARGLDQPPRTSSRRMNSCIAAEASALVHHVRHFAPSSGRPCRLDSFSEALSCPVNRTTGPHWRSARHDQHRDIAWTYIASIDFPRPLVSFLDVSAPPSICDSSTTDLDRSALGWQARTGLSEDGCGGDATFCPWLVRRAFHLRLFAATVYSRRPSALTRGAGPIHCARVWAADCHDASAAFPVASPAAGFSAVSAFAFESYNANGGAG